MPLTKKMKLIKGNFIKRYGTVKGTKFYYGWEKKHYPNKLKLL